MAASDFAALFASVGISFWTQRSFREPLLFSATSCLAGGDRPGGGVHECVFAGWGWEGRALRV